MPSSQQDSVTRLLAAWVGLVCRRAWVVVIISSLAAAAGLAYTVTHISINTSITDMLSAELPFRRHLLAIDQAFPILDKQIVVVIEGRQAEALDQATERLAEGLRAQSSEISEVFYPEGMAFFRRNGLLYLEPSELEDLADRLADAQPLLAVLAADSSLRGLAEVLAEARSADPAQRQALDSAFDAMAETLEALAVGQPATLSWQNLLRGDSVPDDPLRRLVLVKPVLNFASLEPVSAALATIEDQARALGITPDNGLQLRITGETVMLQDELTSVRDGIGLVGLISFILVALLLILCFRSLRLVLATVITLIFGLIWTACFAAVAIGQLNIISVAFAVLFIGLSVDFGIHYALRVLETFGADQPLATAQHRAAVGCCGPLTLTALAAAIGFLSFLPTDYRGLSELGLISGAGMFIALFANLTVLPALLQLMPPKVRASVNKPVAPKLSRFTGFRRVFVWSPRVIVAIALVLGLLASAILPFARFDDDPLNLRDPKSPSVATLLELLDDPRIEPYEAQILRPDLASAEALADELSKLPEVEAAVTLADLVPKDQGAKLDIIEEISFFLTPVLVPAPAPPMADGARLAAKQALENELAGFAETGSQAAGRLRTALAQTGNGNDTLEALEAALFYWLPDRIEALGESLEAGDVALTDLPTPLVARAQAADGQALIRVLPSEDLRDSEARERFVDAVLAIAPGATGGPVIIVAAGEAVRSAFYEAAVLAVVLISVLLIVLLRSVTDSLLVLGPTVLATLLTVAFSALIGPAFNLANVIVLPLLFGLGVAGGIHMVLRSRKHGSVVAEASSTPRAVAYSALTTIGSFGALAMSKHLGTASMGKLLTLAIAMTLLANLVVLPALLRLRETGWRSGSTETSPSTSKE